MEVRELIPPLRLMTSYLHVYESITLWDKIYCPDDEMSYVSKKKIGLAKHSSRYFNTSPNEFIQ